jgi:cellulose synthase/poly-beta-1,6-N-acetylglucosamine synthase-like glycosyltransferase
MTDYVVCIPSYKRAEVCRDKTLATLKKMNIPSSKIYVYVANKEEHEEYEKILDKKTFNKLVVGIKGLVPQRQFIMEQWGEGKHIVFFDDDVQSIDLTMSSRFKGKSLDHFFKEAFKECKTHKSFIWGVYPVFNPFFRKSRAELSTCLNYIVGAFYGIINRPTLKSIQLTITKENGQKEDVERTIKYFVEDGIVLRFNRIGFVTKYYGKSGGLGTFEDRLKPMLEASQKLLKQYGEYGSISTKKHGMTEFRLRKIPAQQNGPDKNNKTQKAIKKTNRTKTSKKLN